MKLANDFYMKHIYDYKAKQYREDAKDVLKVLKIDLQEILPKAMPAFQREHESDEVARMHYNFFHRRRVKVLQKVKEFLEMQKQTKKRLQR